MPGFDLRSVVFSLIIGGFLAVPVISVPAADDSAQESLRYFESEIRPLLIEKCQGCHGPEKQKGKLRLDSLGELLQGGESGPAVVPHKPAESLLIEAVRYESFEMPPDGKLAEDQIAKLVKWVEMGAPWPGSATTPVPKKVESGITDEDRQYWAFQPLAAAAPPVVNTDWCRNEIDPFILRKLSEHNLTPSERAPAAALVRRLYFDLTGLPPTPEQVAAFTANPSADAYEQLVDDLLASPRYGEHWARFWLDLVRYAESDGYRKDDFRPEAWRYRDYVIKAFNEDKPYNRFLTEQLAGDEITPHDPDSLAATGFLRHGIYEYNQRDAKTQWQEIMNDITDTVGDVFLGVGMGCAKCHDHKFDPILQKDYFRLQAFFANISFRDDIPLATPDEIRAYREKLAAWEEATASVRAEIDAMEKPIRDKYAHEAIIKFPEDVQALMAKSEAERNSYEKQICYLVELQILEEWAKIPTVFKDDKKAKYEELQAKLKQFDALKPAPLPLGRTVWDYGAQAPPVYIAGKERLGEVAPGFLSILDAAPAAIIPVSTGSETSGRRSTLAAWLTREDHPLVSRVIVNRIWKEHFGTGIVATPSDFGHLGEVPSHPELLDWLAANFIRHGWSLKWLHKQIVMSASWQQSALRRDPQAEIVDPLNRLLWRANVRRLEAEQIRDSFLAITGELDLRGGGPSRDVAKSVNRSVYNKVLRNSQDPFLTIFDFPDRIASAGNRNSTTSPAQSLSLLNGDWAIARARAFANRLTKEVPSGPESQIREGYRLALGRDPGEAELARMIAYLDTLRTAPGPGPKVSVGPAGMTQALEVGAGAPAAQMENREFHLGERFTIEATVLLRSLYPDASVRTIVSDWNSQTGEPGWALGVTSEKSAFKPRNLILQFVGLDSAGKRKYEVVPSNLRLELNQPYRVAVTVDLTQPGEEGVTFVLKNLTTGAVEQAHVPHTVVKHEPNTFPVILGGRDGSNTHRWDGWLDDLVITETALTAAQLADPNLPRDGLLARWDFESTENPLADVAQNLLLNAVGAASAMSQGLVDICHVLLNSNELIYID